MAAGRVLIVEDEEIARSLYKRLLERLDCLFDMASTITDARGLMSSASDYDLLVTDVRLPDGRGTDILAEFHRRWPHARILIVTGSPEMTPDNSAAEAAGAEWLYKPFELDEFTGAIERLLLRPSKP